MSHGIAVYDQAGALVTNTDRLGRLVINAEILFTGVSGETKTLVFPAFDSTRGALFWSYYNIPNTRWNAARVNGTNGGYPYWNNTTKELKATVFAGTQFVVWGFMFA